MAYQAQHESGRATVADDPYVVLGVAPGITAEQREQIGKVCV